MTEEEFCARIGIEQTTFQVWLEEGWLTPTRDEAGVILSEIDLARVRLIRDLRANIGVNDEAVGVILHLIGQVHGLRTILQAALQSRSADHPG